MDEHYRPSLSPILHKNPDSRVDFDEQGIPTPPR